MSVVPRMIRRASRSSARSYASTGCSWLTVTRRLSVLLPLSWEYTPRIALPNGWRWGAQRPALPLPQEQYPPVSMPTRLPELFMTGPRVVNLGLEPLCHTTGGAWRPGRACRLAPTRQR